MGLRVAILSPYCWPYVRRGSERFAQELADFLRARGHEVTLVATAPSGQHSPGRCGDRILYRQLGPRRPRYRWCPTAGNLFGFQALAALARHRFDVVHCMTSETALAAGLPRLLRKLKVVFHIVGIPVAWYLPARSPGGLLFRLAISQSDRLVVISRCAQQHLRCDFGHESQLLPIPVSLSPFRAVAKDPQRPLILMAGDMDELRKGAEPLARAFVRVRQSIPKARLVLSGHVSRQTARCILSVAPESMRADIEMPGVGTLEELDELYRRASVTVLPAIWEAFGMVLLESLARGTPVVGADHGGIPDIIDRPGTGVLFDPVPVGQTAGNIQGLAEAILLGLELARRPQTCRLCREHADLFSWERLGPEYERLYLELLDRPQEAPA